MTRLPLVAALLALVPPAAAQTSPPDHPAALPTRDVDITYIAQQSGQMFQQRSRFDASTKRMRLDTPTKGLYMIVDYGAKRLSMITEADRAVLDMPTPNTGLPGPVQAGEKPGQTYIRRESRQIAGIDCTEWETRDNRNQPVLTCFTADGVLLGARQGDTVLAVATQVTYGPMDPALFDIPAGYQHLAKPAP